ncbi:hypothetical protein ABT404_37955 [Streptomyces hyaluromycini]|uniref:Uncharacterized protein n=1 Tax=Streptomyces hyaluromycini TaxID=1377993 RepID=A0ABV1X831_9ACTN
MTGPGVPRELRPVAGAGAPDGPAEWAFATHKRCPVDGCPGPARAPLRSAARPPALEHGDPGDHGDHGHDTTPCRRCGGGPCGPAEV